MDVNQHWHSDMIITKTPKLTMLYALEAPEFGGETAFANQILAYKAFRRFQRNRWLGGLSYRWRFGADIWGKIEKAPSAEHPLARIHDENKQKGLYACRAFTKKIVGGLDRKAAMLSFYLNTRSA